MLGFCGTLGGAWTLGAATTTGDGAANIRLLVSNHANEINNRLTVSSEASERGFGLEEQKCYRKEIYFKFTFQVLSFVNKVKV